MWYVVGSIIGGATLGLCVAGLTVAVDASPSPRVKSSSSALGASAVAVLSDAGLGGFHLPVHHRQVNERWLDRFRPWVYGAGFGWQIGTGLATYIMTAAVYLMIVLGALSGQPWLGVAFGALFGLVRGLSVCLGRHITSTEALPAFHRRFFELRAYGASRHDRRRGGGNGALRLAAFAVGRACRGCGGAPSAWCSAASSRARTADGSADDAAADARRTGGVADVASGSE